MTGLESTRSSLWRSLSYFGVPRGVRQGLASRNYVPTSLEVVQFFLSLEVRDTSSSWSKTVVASGGVLLVSSTMTVSVILLRAVVPPGTSAKSTTETLSRTSFPLLALTRPRTLLYLVATATISSGSLVDSVTTSVSGELLWRVSFP